MAKRVFTLLLTVMLVASSTVFGEEALPVSDAVTPMSDEGVNTPENLFTSPLDGSCLTDSASVSPNSQSANHEDYKLSNAAAISLTDEDAVAADLSAITINSLLSAPLAENKYLLDSLSLPREGEEGSVITWDSSDKRIIATNGMVTRPLMNNTEVTLTATVTKGKARRTSEFKFTVAALKSQPAKMPSLMGTVHGDDFEDGTYDSTLLASSVTGGSIRASDGKLSLTRSSDGNSYIRFYLSKNKKETDDKKYYMEFVTSRTKAVNVLTRSYDAIGTYGHNVTAIDWGADGSVSYYNGSTSKKLSASSSRVKDMKWGILIDTISDTYSLWLDNVLVLENIHVRESDASGFRYIQFYMEGSNYSTLNFESYRIYNVWTDMEDSERVESDKDVVVYENLFTTAYLAPGIINTDLQLPVAGANGTEIIWESSDENIISNDGTVTPPATDGFYEVTLTSVIKSGSVSHQKEYVFTIPGSMVEFDTDVGIDSSVCYNDFESDKYDNRIATDSQNYTDVFGIKNGKYEVTRIDNTNESTYVRMYPTASTSQDNALKGVVAVEFDMTRNKNEILKAVLTSNDGGYLTIEWQSSGNIILGQRNSADDASVSWLSVNRSFNNNEGVSARVLLDTRRSLYSLWLNDELVVVNHYSRVADCDTYRYTEFTCGGSGSFTWTVDNYKVYYAIPPAFMRADYDIVSVTQESILTNAPVTENFIDSDLNLYKKLAYGSDVRWESSRPDVINPETGKVTRPLGTEKDVQVTVTAYVSNLGITKSVSFDFVVLREFATSADFEKADFERLDYELLTSEDKSAVTHYLNLMNKGVYGSDISWSSSDNRYIAPSGRVVRPRWNEAPVEVTLTATIAKKYTKSFTFVVMPDEKPVDKQTFTDEDFFGVWNGSSWSDEPTLNYSYAGLQNVEAAVKAGDYNLAQEELLTHMQNRNVKSPVSLPGRNTPWVNSLVTGLADMQSAAYYIGEGKVKSAEYQKVSVTISDMDISFADVKNYDIIAKHNDTTDIIIAGTDYHDSSMRPVMKLYVNGSARYYKVVQSATVRTGDYKKTHIDNNAELTVKMFGDFLGNETYRTMLMFDFYDIKSTDTVGKGELTFYAKKSTAYSEDKEFFVLKDPCVDWDEKSVCWNDLKTYVHNFNGIPGGNHWRNVDGTDVEYAYQSCRFYGYDEMLKEYLSTGDEIYAYTLIQRMMDFINDTAGKGSYGHPRTLDTAVRMEAWIAMYNYIVDLSWVDAEINTAIVKNMYKAMMVLLNSGATTANWIQTEKTYAYNTAVFFPEFSNSEEVKQMVIDHFTNALFADYYPDGAYIEDTGSYHTGAFSKYINARKMIVAGGGEVSKEYDEILRRGAYYVLFLRGPAGENLAYGDSGTGGASTSERYASLSKLYEDSELKYIDTFGEQGTKPSWTSAHLPYSTYTFMRSDWSKTASYLFTNVRNGGTHGHKDDNAVIVFAKGRNHLVDAGYVSYTSGADRSQAVSTKGHNTVSINDESHESVTGYNLMYGNQGEVHNWETNDEYDFLSQTTKGYTHINNDHRRTITFVKPGFWIISDLCTPDDKTQINNYKQNWHMLPSSDVTVDENNVFSTNFSDGANIMVATADDDVTPVLTEGVYTSSYGQAMENPWAYYEKNAAGDVSFDTVLIPYDGTKATVNTERIPLYDPDTGKQLATTDATSLKFTSSTSDGDMTVYYLLNYNPDGRTITFDKYKSDAMLTVVVEDKHGNVRQIVQSGGTKLTTADDKTVEEIEYPLYYIKTDATENGGYKADFYCIKDDGEYPVANCVIALYDGNEFITFKTSPIKSGTSDVTAPAVSLNFDAKEIPSDATKVRVKAFVWKDNTLTPVATNAPIPAP